VVDLSDFERKRRHSSDHPSGWEPSLQWDGSKGTITTGPLASEPDDAIWEQLISDWGLDPSRTEVVDGSLQIRAWDSMLNGESVRMKYYRATIKPRTNFADHADIDALCKLAEKKIPSKTIPVDTPKGVFLVLASDWQLGKSEGGGSEATVERIRSAFSSAVARYKQLRKEGKASVVYLIGLGDLVEGCADFYAQQTFQADLSDREQDRLARRLILSAIDAFVDAGAERIVAMGVPGNHGENRRGGKAFTDWLDNRDYAAFEAVSDIISVNPERYANVSIPLNALNADDLSMTLDLGGIPVGFIHGHQLRSGTNSQAKLEGWWKGQALGRTGVADAEILFSGHFHHFVVSEGTGRTVVQVPAMDGGSKWFTSTSGSSSPAGMVTVLVGSGVGTRGWTDLLIV